MKLQFDTYGYMADEVRGRHEKCSCEVPCQERYQCECPTHKGSRATPWCSGAYDEYFSWCDDCVSAELRTKDEIEGIVIRFVDPPLWNEGSL